MLDFQSDRFLRFPHVWNGAVDPSVMKLIDTAHQVAGHLGQDAGWLTANVNLGQCQLWLAQLKLLRACKMTLLGLLHVSALVFGPVAKETQKRIQFSESRNEQKQLGRSRDPLGYGGPALWQVSYMGSIGLGCTVDGQNHSCPFSRCENILLKRGQTCRTP